MVEGSIYIPKASGYCAHKALAFRAGVTEYLVTLTAFHSIIISNLEKHIKIIFSDPKL